MTDLTVPSTILSQLASDHRRLSLMIGAHDFVADERSLTFRFYARASNGSNCCRVTLQASDTYTVEFLSVRGTSVKTKDKLDDVYAESLKETFERHTGLYFTIPRLVAI